MLAPRLGHYYNYNRRENVIYRPDVFPVEITQQVDLSNPDRVVVGVVAVRHPVVRQDHHVHKLLHLSLIEPTFQMNQR